MFVLKYFKNTSGRPSIGRQALSVIFFLQICNEVPGKKGACRPPRATGATPPRATGVTLLYKDPTPLPSSFEPENSTKIQKKIEG